MLSNEDVFQILHLPFKVTNANIKENTKIEVIISVTKVRLLELICRRRCHGGFISSLIIYRTYTNKSNKDSYREHYITALMFTRETVAF